MGLSLFRNLLTSSLFHCVAVMWAKIRLWAGRSGIRILAGAALAATQLSFRWVLGFFVGGDKKPGHEAYHLPPTGAMVKNDYFTYMHSWCGQGQLYLYLFLSPLDLPTLKVPCAVHAGLLDGLQHMIRLNPKSWRILEVGREILNTQITVNWFLASASVGMWWTIFVMLLHHTIAVTLRLHLFTTVRIHIVVFVCYETVYLGWWIKCDSTVLAQSTNSMK